MPDTVEAFDLTRPSSAFALVGEPFPPVGDLLSRIGVAVSPVGDSVASVRRRFAHPHAVLSPFQLCRPHLRLDLAHLELGVQILRARRSRDVRFAPCDYFAYAFGDDHLRPTPFQCRASALVRSRVAVQARTRTIALFLPERCRSLMRERGALMASNGLLVAAQRSDYLAIIARQPAVVAAGRVADRKAIAPEAPPS